MNVPTEAYIEVVKELQRRRDYAKTRPELLGEYVGYDYALDLVCRKIGGGLPPPE